VTSAIKGARRPLLRPVIGLGVIAFALSASIASLVVWGTSIIDILSYIAIPLAFGGIGALLWTRVPGNPIGPMLLIATVGFAALIGSGTWVVVNVDGVTTDPRAVLMGLVANLSFIPSLILVIVGVPLVFPDGRFLSARWRWVAVAAGVVVATAELGILLGQPMLMDPLIANPFYRPDAEPLFEIVAGAEGVAAIPVFALAVWSLALRYRRSGDVGRHQIRWLAAAASAAVVGFASSFFAPPDLAQTFEALGILALNSIPIAIGIAIVRYRLYEIDRLISRGISYAVVTLVLLGTYATVVLLLQGPIGTIFGTQTVTVAVSTLVVAALFQPVRRRVQRAVDRRFHRAHVDAERTSAAFSERLREEVDIDTVVADLALTARAAVSPASIQLWLRDAAPIAAGERQA
jgi:hypothetical protein